MDFQAEVQEAVNTWNNVDTAQNVLGTLSQSTVNFTKANFGTAWGRTNPGDGQHEVVFDDDGSVIRDIGGLNPATIEGITLVPQVVVGGQGVIPDIYVVINGSPGIPFDHLSVIVHELGHAQGLQHSTVGMNNGAFSMRGALDVIHNGSLPTMHPGSGSSGIARARTLEPDDVAALSELYPEASFTTTFGSIDGTVNRCSNNNAVTGANVRAISTSNPNIQLSRFTGFDGNNQGRYVINGLPPGSYRIVVEPLLVSNHFSLGDFGHPPTSAERNFATEYHNASSQEDDCYENLPESPTNVDVGGGTIAANKNFKVQNPLTFRRIVSLDPSEGSQGQTLDVTITGEATDFVNGRSVARFVCNSCSGTDIFVNSTTVTSPTSAIATIVIAADARVRDYNVFVTTGSETAEAFLSFRVSEGRFNPGANGSVFTIAVQENGKILVGGQFTGLGGGTGTTTRNFIGRLNDDGSLDTDFNPGADGTVRTIVVQGDGKILVGGDFTHLGGQPRNGIGRLEQNGRLDPNFINPRAVGSVRTIALQADGSILVGGDFTHLGGQPRNHIGRLDRNGRLRSFNPGADGTVRTIVVQANRDRDILVGGAFTRLGGGDRNRIGRLKEDGSRDSSFNPGADGEVFAIALQADGKILVGGRFQMLGGQLRRRIGRLDRNGNLDPNFKPGANDHIRTIVVQANKDILVGGTFSALGGSGASTYIRRRNIGRFTENGMLTDFDPGANRVVRAIVVQADGKILVGGGFITLGGGGRGTTVRFFIGWLDPIDGSITNFNPGANDHIRTILVQANRDILVGGAFTWLGGGGTGMTMRNRIGPLTNTAAALQNPPRHQFYHPLVMQRR